ncbi:MAG: PAS domain-containing protein [Desulfobacterales bacterium]
MIDNIEAHKIAIVGGGQRCKALLEAFYENSSLAKGPEILGVADKDQDAAGFQYARSKGIFTTTDYHELFELENLSLILELTPDDTLNAAIRKAKPPWVLFVDHYDALAILDEFQIQHKKSEILHNIHQSPDDRELVLSQFEAFHDFVSAINRERNVYAQETRQKLVANENTMSQIIDGSTIPTFVIDQNHIVTHWNRACEKLTGYKAKEMVGSDHQWKPFRSEKRPTMADLILEGIQEEDLWRHYGTRWEKSNLIRGGYQVAEFFPHIGPQGTWLFFTAVPLRGPDGTKIGAIETLWDQTAQKEAEAEREQKNRELAAKVEELIASEQTMAQIINGSTIPTFVIDKAHTITHWNRALERLSGRPAQEMIGTRNQWQPFYDAARPSMADVILEQYDAGQIQKLYGSKWRPSALLDEAFEAEVFFPNLGPKGKWCWFTAAPIKNPDGEILGAIETIWDKTEDRLAEKEREQHTKELATFCSIYATLSSALSLEERIKAAIEEVVNIFLLDGICIFTRQAND